MSKEIQLRVIHLFMNQTAVPTYGLALGEMNGDRHFSVLIGEPEAQSIALKRQNKTTDRPLTHDLIHNILLLFGAELKKVLIYEMTNEIFYSELHLKYNGEIVVIDTRTSDAVALAVRCDCPIYIKAEVFDVVGTTSNSDSETAALSDKNSINLEHLNEKDLLPFSLEDLGELLEQAVNSENYESAVLIRDTMKRIEN